ncbi:MAG: glycosyltransferase family 2 protein [Leptolyngbyaceae cyanobacterium RU_5_1]|nr:glycosyltransferase family 2 protein [Leptolyngbyaceae cyanobacterium RU_5_1]
MKISLIIPVYNEEANLHQFLSIIDSLEFSIEKELIIIDDCSIDASNHILNEFPFRSAVVILRQPVNQGKGAAIRLGIEKATGDIIGVQDADFEYNPADIDQLILPIIANKADIVYGSRYKKSGEQVHRTYHYLVNRFLTLLSNLLSGLYLTDMETCYKFFKSEILQNIQLTSERFGFEPEITAKIARLKVRIHEYPISYYPRNYDQGKKITWKDGVAALWYIVYFNLIAHPSNYLRPSLDRKYIPVSKNWL